MTKRCDELLETTEASIKENLLASNHLHLDEQAVMSMERDTGFT